MKLLLIEDYAPIRETLTEGLREAGFAVDAAANGGDGLHFAQTGKYDVIVLDIMLPQVDGLTILERIRRQKLPVHVLILTAKDSIDDRVKGLNLGADDY